ncbi:MAG: dephospho-CoA kinase [Devosia sp.]
MWKIGLTGSIATGKSTVLKAFADLGVPTFSSDGAVHELYRGEAVPVVEALFPGVTRDGVIDRQALGQRVLGNSEKLKALESAIHPLVRNRIGKFLADAQSTGAALAVVDIPLLFEGGFDYGLDRVAVTMAEEQTYRARALARPGMTVEKLDAILARQLPQDEKRKRADYLIYTEHSLDETKAAVKALVDVLTTNPSGIA